MPRAVRAGVQPAPGRIPSIHGSRARHVGRISRHAEADRQIAACYSPAGDQDNDYVARGVMEALAMAAIRVPQQINVVGYDDLGVMTTPPMTTIRVDLDKVGRMAVEALYRRIEGTR